MLRKVHLRRRRLSAILVLGALVASVGVLTASAGADSSPGPTVVTFSATKASPPTSPVGGASPQATITCNLTIDNPHKSTHVPETVNVVSNVTCDNVVSSISITTKLFRAGIQVASSNSFGAEVFMLNGNAAVNCVNGEYGGTADATVVFPPGYSPPSESGHVASPVVNITC